MTLAGSSEWLLLEESLRRLRIDLAQAKDLQSSLQALNVAERALLLFPVESRVREVFDLGRDSLGGSGEVRASLEVPSGLEIPRLWESLLSEFVVEGLRNWKAHGRESRAERKFLNKPDSYQVLLRSWISEGSVFFSLEDDGPGLHSALVMARAEEMGLLLSDERRQMEEALRKGNSDPAYQLLFRDGLSTRSEADINSGRGMGLSRLSHEASRLGGGIRALKSQILGGLCLRLELPCKVLGARVSPVSRGDSSTESLFTLENASMASEFRVFSLLPPESASWARERFGSAKVGWVSIEALVPGIPGFRTDGLVISRNREGAVS